MSYKTAKYAIWIVMFFIFFVAYLDRANVSVLISSHDYINSLGIADNKGLQGLLMTAFLFFYGLGSFFVGSIINRFGPKKILNYSLLAWAIISAIMASTSTFDVHIICRALLGLTEAAAGPVCGKLIHTWFAPKERAKANAAWFIGLNFSLLVGIPFVSVLVEHLGWSGSFYSLAIINLIPIIACIILVYDSIQSHPKISPEEKALILQSYDSESKIQTSSSSFAFLNKSAFYLPVIIYAMNLSIFWGISAWLPTYLKVTQGLSITKTGIFSALPYIINIVFLIIFTPLMDKLNLRAIFTFVGGVLITIFIYIVSISSNSMIALAFISLSFGCITVANCSLFPILQNKLDSHEIATATGFLTGVAYIISSAFPYIMGMIYNHTNSMSAGFSMLVFTGIFSAIASIPMALKRF